MAMKCNEASVSCENNPTGTCEKKMLPPLKNLTLQ
jgi:hypothetical protein